MSYTEAHEFDTGEFEALFGVDPTPGGHSLGWASFDHGALPPISNTGSVAFSVADAERFLRESAYRGELAAGYLCLARAANSSGALWRARGLEFNLSDLADRRLGTRHAAYAAYTRMSDEILSLDERLFLSHGHATSAAFAHDDRLDPWQPAVPPTLLEGGPQAVIDMHASQHFARGVRLMRISVLTLLGLMLTSVFASLAGQAIGLAVLFAAGLAYCFLDYANFRLHDVSVLSPRISLMSVFGFAGLCSTMVISAF